MNFVRLITARFAPHSVDLGLLALRLWFGLSLFYIYGFNKLRYFDAFIDKMKAFPWILAAAAILTEGIASLFLAIGLGTRWAALLLTILMSVAFFHVHGGNLNPEQPVNGIMAFVYLGPFVVLLIAGPGRYSADAFLEKSKK